MHRSISTEVRIVWDLGRFHLKSQKKLQHIQQCHESQQDRVNCQDKNYTIVKALIIGISCDGAFLAAYARRCTCRYPQEEFVPVQTKNYVDRMTECLTCQNVDDWFENEKFLLIKYFCSISRFHMQVYI